VRNGRKFRADPSIGGAKDRPYIPINFWRVHQIEHDATVDARLTRYKLDVIPTKAAATRRGDIQALINMRRVFGAMR
jgi:hypothetical protein